MVVLSVAIGQACHALLPVFYKLLQKLRIRATVVVRVASHLKVVPYFLAKSKS